VIKHIIELKSSLHHPHGPLPQDLQYGLEQGKLQPVQVRKEMQKRLNKEVPETIAAFLNTKGGTLVIGVDDHGTTLGIEPDFEYCQKNKQDADGWLLSLKTVIINALGGDVWNAIRVSLVPHTEKMVAVILCPPVQARPGTTKIGAKAFTSERGMQQRNYEVAGSSDTSVNVGPMILKSTGSSRRADRQAQACLAPDTECDARKDRVRVAAPHRTMDPYPRVITDCRHAPIGPPHMSRNSA
jgi:hypothetical protein